MIKFICSLWTFSSDSKPEDNKSATNVDKEGKSVGDQMESANITRIPSKRDKSFEVKAKPLESDSLTLSDSTPVGIESKNADVSVKVEQESSNNCEEAPGLIDEQKDLSVESDPHHDEEVGASSESETSIRDNASGGSEEFRMDVDLPTTDVKAEVIEDQEKSTDSGIVSEQTPKKTSLKRANDENLPNGQTKKQCLPDIVCGDANALDLSGIKKKDCKEPKIALKPQSLLLSKLQGTSEMERSKRDVYRNTNENARHGEPCLPARPGRRRSSREDKDSRSNYQRRSSDSNASPALERDQVLREMRARVRSSYKEREKAAKEDNSLLRDLLEPERESLMTDFVEAATHNGGISELDKVSTALEAEIRQLAVDINAKEAEWNDLIRKKKLKEELALRIYRRKQVLALTGDSDDDLARRMSVEDDSRADTKRDSSLDSRLERRHDHFRDPIPKSGEELLAAALRLGSRNVEDYHHRNSSSSPLARVLMGAVSSTGSACRLSPSVSLSAIPTPTSTSSALNASLTSAAVHNKGLSRADKQASSASASRNQRPILPKPSTATSGGHVMSDSIMAGARPGSSSGGGLLSMSLPALGSGSHVRTGSSSSGLHGSGAVDLSELGFVLSSGAGSDGPSRPSSTESSLSGAPSQVNPETGSGMSFKDVLVQFAKMTNAGDQGSLSNQAALLARPPPPPYPEVTLHPVPVPSPVPAAAAPSTSLLHGILTKPNNQSSISMNQSHSKPTTFSPTLARLLTAPERTSTSSAHHSSSASVLPHYQTSVASNYSSTGPVLLSDLLSGGTSKKARSELTITPVGASNSSSSAARVKSNDDVVVLDGEDGGDMNGDDGDADTDSDERRLVIDEGDNGESGESPETDGRLDRSKASVPHCQGCNERDAEFVCAGCQRQWYCSRECQIAAWDEHSEQCFPASSDN